MPIVSTWVPDPPLELRYRLRVDTVKHPQLALYLWSCMGNRANNDLLVAVLEAGYAALMSQASDASSLAGQAAAPVRPPPSSTASRQRKQPSRPRSAPAVSDSPLPQSARHPDPQAASNVTLDGSSSASAHSLGEVPALPSTSAQPGSSRVPAADPFAGSRPLEPEPSPYGDPDSHSDSDSAPSSLLSKFISL